MDGSELTKRRVIEYIGKGKRFDGRGLLDHREIKIETGISKNAEGSARVKLGNTEVVAGVKLDVGTPYPDHEEEGTMITTLELLPLSSEEFNYGPPGINSIEIARIVDRGLRESGFIDFNKLCIKKGEKVWNIFVDMYSMNDDGGLLDACCLAAVAALLDAKMPKYDEKTERVVYGEFTTKKIPITKVVPLTFTFYKIGKKVVIDPTIDEEHASDGKISFALAYNDKKEIWINAAQKGNDGAFSEEEMAEIIDSAEKKYPSFFKEITGAAEKGLKHKKE